jgi:hypothetical protein
MQIFIGEHAPTASRKGRTLLRDVYLLLFVDAPREEDDSADDRDNGTDARQDSIGGAALRPGSSQENNELVDSKDGGGDAYDQTQNVFQATHIEPPAFASKTKNDDA